MHVTMWLIGCRPKALYFSHAQGRAPSKEIEDQKYGYTISLSFLRKAHAQNTELNFISGKDQRHARGDCAYSQFTGEGGKEKRTSRKDAWHA